MGAFGTHYDLSRFGAEVVRFSPRQADVLLVAGTINYKMAPVLKRIYDQMLEPKWVISMGACACSGGFYNNYTVLQGIDKIMPGRRLHPRVPAEPRGDHRRRRADPEDHRDRRAPRGGTVADQMKGRGAA